MVTNENVLKGLMEDACKYGANEDDPYMKLLHIIMDMEYRIKVLETKPDPIPMFSEIPITPIINFMTANERREKMGLPPLTSKELNKNEQLICSHLVSKGCDCKEAAAIAREVEGMTNEK
jgi:hypothetical protein